MRPDAEGFFRRGLIAEEYVSIMDPANPLAAGPMTLDDYLRARHVGIDYGRGWSSSYVTILRSMGHELRPTITVPSPAGLADLITGTDLIATVPDQFARSLVSGLHVAICPVSAPFEIALVWTSRTHGSPVHRWFRDMIVATVGESLGGG
jgi:DNA-binding transcriptional LysR family regulator